MNRMRKINEEAIVVFLMRSKDDLVVWYQGKKIDMDRFGTY